MYKRIKTSSQKLHLEEGDDAIINYYVLISSSCEGESDAPSVAYGCEIEMCRESKKGEYECERVTDIFRSDCEIYPFLELISRERVTPCTLKDIVYDYISK